VAAETGSPVVHGKDVAVALGSGAAGGASGDRLIGRRWKARECMGSMDFFVLSLQAIFSLRLLCSSIKHT
jgi:hypothetical protein